MSSAVVRRRRGDAKGSAEGAAGADATRSGSGLLRLRIGGVPPVRRNGSLGQLTDEAMLHEVSQDKGEKAMSLRRSMLVAGFGVLVSGCCGSTEVYRVSTVDRQGVPFFPLVAANTETRTYEQQWIRLDVTLAGSAEANGEPVSVSRTVTLFAGGHDPDNAVGKLLKELDHLKLAVSDARHAEDGGKRPKGHHAAKEPPKAARRVVSEWNEALRILDNARLGPDWSSAEPAPIPLNRDRNVLGLPASELHSGEAGRGIFDLPVTAVSRGVTQLPAISPSYINVAAPHGGSGSAQISLNAEGELTSAQGQVQDQLPASTNTLIGTALTAAATVGAAGLALLAAKPKPPTPSAHGTAEAPMLTALSVNVTPGARTYAVTAVWPISEKLAAPQAISPPQFEDTTRDPCFPTQSPVPSDCMMTVKTAIAGASAPPAKPAKKKKP